MADDFRDLFENWKPGEEPEKERPSRGDDGDALEQTSETENFSPRVLNEKEVKVLGLWGLSDPQNPNMPPQQMYVLLRDNRGRRAPIFIGPFETMAIQMALEGRTPERPLPHDLLKNVIERLGGSVERVTIDDLWQGTFYAKIAISLKDGTSYDIDSRPSDAIAVALRARAPIYMAEDVIEVVGKEEPEAE